MADEEQKKTQKPDDEPSGKVYDSRLMRRLGHYLRPYWWQAAVSTLAISLKSLCDVSGPYLIMVGIDRYFSADDGASHSTSLLSHTPGTTNWLTTPLPHHPSAGVN